jgi:Flp pilus assembly protein TadD
VEAAANLGFLDALRGDERGAEEWYRKAIAEDPRYPRVWRRLADLHYERGDFAKALENYRKTLDSQPADFEATLQAGNAARRTERPVDAARYFQAAAKLRPDSWIPYYNLACLRASRGEAERAVKFLETSLKHGLANPALLRQDPDLASVRQRPEYPSLLRLAEEKGARRKEERGAAKPARPRRAK